MDGVILGVTVIDGVTDMDGVILGVTDGVTDIDGVGVTEGATT